MTVVMMSRRLLPFGLLVVSVGYAAFLAWQEWGYRESLVSPLSFATALRAPSPHAPVDSTAITTVLGLSPETPLLASAEPMTLQASFVLGTGLSKALLADAQGARIYQVGDPLPGGSVLRRVEANQAVLWNRGREEVLALQTSTASFLRRFDGQAEAQPPAISTRYLRPHSGPSE
ncbi:hypothetical protein ACYZT4_19135 [Pseudomonas sp. GB2N2]